MNANDFHTDWPEDDIRMEDRRHGCSIIRHAGKWIERRRVACSELSGLGIEVHLSSSYPPIDMDHGVFRNRKGKATEPPENVD